MLNLLRPVIAVMSEFQYQGGSVRNARTLQGNDVVVTSGWRASKT
jgi:hypothetical protein